MSGKLGLAHFTSSVRILFNLSDAGSYYEVAILVEMVIRVYLFMPPRDSLVIDEYLGLRSCPIFVLSDLAIFSPGLFVEI